MITKLLTIIAASICSILDYLEQANTKVDTWGHKR